jgi:tRNA (guanine-N7-)-methyltransferase
MTQGPEDKDAAASLRPRFFGRRSGKALRRNALGLIDGLLPRLAIAIPKPGDRIDTATLFGHAVAETWLEVGFGGGEHLAQLAGLRPDVGLIGCEVFKNGIASLLGHIQAGGIETIRIFPEDARLLFPALAPGSLGRVFVLFPDPWPKTRHAERRFIGPENLDSLAVLMAPGAELRVASDDPVYVAWARQQLEDHPAFERLLDTTDRSTVPADWPVTRYEQKCIASKTPTFFLYRRKAV